MSEVDKEQPVRVNDRRRFDPSGELRPELSPEEQAEAAASASTLSGDEGDAVNSPSTSAEAAKAQAEVLSLRAELEVARKRVDELARGLQSIMKDREEFKQRLTRERERMIDIERGNVALALVEALDELDRCLSVGSSDASPLAQGVRLIREGLLQKLQSTGIERIEVVGQPFDPNLAEAADMELTTAPQDDQKVLAEVRAGYRLKDRIIRPARVKVAKYVQPAQA